MTLFDDGMGSLLELLRPKSAIARLEARAEAPPPQVAYIARPERGVQRAAIRLDRALQSALAGPAYAPWRGHLAAVAAGAAPLSSVLAESRTALLTPVPEGGGASLAWFAGAAAVPPRLYLAALIPARARRRSHVHLDADLSCDLCEQPLYTPRHELRQLGARGGAWLEVAPICVTCLDALARDPERWERRRVRHAAARQKLRVVRGG